MCGHHTTSHDKILVSDQIISQLTRLYSFVDQLGSAHPYHTLPYHSYAPLSYKSLNGPKGASPEGMLHGYTGRSKENCE